MQVKAEVRPLYGPPVPEEGFIVLRFGMGPTDKRAGQEQCWYAI